MSIHSLVGSGSSSAPHSSAWSPPDGRLTHNGTPSHTRPGSPGPGLSNQTEGLSRPTYTTVSQRENGRDHFQDLSDIKRNRSPSMYKPQHEERPDNSAHGFSRLLQPLHHFSTPSQAGHHSARPFSQPAGADPRDSRPPPPFVNLSEAGSDQQRGAAYRRSSRDRAVSDLDGKRIDLFAHTFSRPDPDRLYGRIGEQPAPPASGGLRDPEMGPSPRHANHYDLPQEGRRWEQNGHLPPWSRAEARHEPHVDRGEHYVAAEHPSSAPTKISYDGYRPDPQYARPSQIIPSGADNGVRPSIEDSNRAQNRSIFGLAHEAARRIERSSPLPQAVQGAQSQPSGSGNNPNIKLEFGRMFSGLGSTPQPHNGSTTPNRRSPLDEMKQPDPGARRGNKYSSLGTSRSAKRDKKGEVEKGGIDDSGDESKLNAPATGKNAKRNRNAQPQVLHHHHHAAAPQ